jgi:hypothetical protein
MAGEIYRPLIEDMTWSYSRIKTFDDCPYKWYQHYILGLEEEPMFYSSFGSFMHSLLAQFYSGELTRQQMKMRFLTGFSSEVGGNRPPGGTVEKYIVQALNYIETFEPFEFNLLGIEEEIRFDFAGLPFLCYIDLLGERNGDIIIVDHKSRELKQRSKRAKPTVKDKELDEMLVQLYVYAEAVKSKYGKYPTKLCFNCFRNSEVIEEVFVHEKLEEAKRWAVRTTERIKNVEEFYPNYDYFSCSSLCGLYEECEYYEMMRKR